MQTLHGAGRTKKKIEKTIYLYFHVNFLTNVNLPF